MKLDGSPCQLQSLTALNSSKPRLIHWEELSGLARTSSSSGMTLSTKSTAIKSWIQNEQGCALRAWKIWRRSNWNWPWKMLSLWWKHLLKYQSLQPEIFQLNSSALSSTRILFVDVALPKNWLIVNPNQRSMLEAKEKCLVKSVWLVWPLDVASATLAWNLPLRNHVWTGSAGSLLFPNVPALPRSQRTSKQNNSLFNFIYPRSMVF